MKKSVYSIVLMDRVIDAVDEEAYRLGTSRSNLINQILAEHLNCTTPEMKMRTIFAAINDAMNSHFQIQQQRSDSLLTLRTALNYRYRPVLNYKVELSRSPENYIGVLRVQIRTQNPSLTALFDSFFSFWTKLEQVLLSNAGCFYYSYSLSPNSFSRELINSGSGSAEIISSAIAGYIQLLDKAIKLYISAPNAFASAAPEIEHEYRSILTHTII